MLGDEESTESGLQNSNTTLSRAEALWSGAGAMMHRSLTSRARLRSQPTALGQQSSRRELYPQLLGALLSTIASKWACSRAPFGIRRTMRHSFVLSIRCFANVKLMPGNTFSA